MRPTNLIQSYVNSSPITQQYNTDKTVRDFDVRKELSNRTFIKPLPSNGKLIHNTIFDVPSEIAKDIKYDTNALRHAVKGKANDHELGRLNDVAMKTGGLAIAAYLFTKKQTPMTKLFEFIGLGSFFAAMDLWPKLMIQLPAWLIHGVNVRQKYEDSYGRKKMFYQDHQFIPWDLYSEKEINKIGDRLRVPKDIPNRREFIQEKMRKIALQNNTMWMLTAGFATPLMSALICNRLEQPIAKYLDKKNDQKASALLTNFSSEINKYNFTKETEELSTILSKNKDKPIIPKVINEIHANLASGMDNVVSQAIRKDLEKMLQYDKKYSITSQTLINVNKVLKEAFAPVGLSNDELKQIIPDERALSEAFASHNLLGGNFSDFSEHSKVLQRLLEEKITQFGTANPDNPKAAKLDFMLTKFLHSAEHGKNSKLIDVFKAKSAAVLTDENIKNIKSISTVLNKLKAEVSVLDKYAYIKVAQAPETGLANSWNTINNSFLKLMHFTPEEIKKGRYDSEIAGEVLRNRLEQITANKETYQEFVAGMQQLLASLQDKMQPLDMSQDESKNLYKTLVNSSFDEAAGNLGKYGMNHAIEALVGMDGIQKTSAKDLMYEFVIGRIDGVKSSLYKLLDAADVFYKISHNQGLENILTKDMPREVKEELVEGVKQILIGGHASDYSVKFWQKRNPNPNREDCSDIEVVNGKVKNKYHGKTPSSQLVEFANDRVYFEKLMKLMYGNDLHPDTLNKLTSTVIFDDFKNYREAVLKFLGGDEYFAKPNFLVDGQRHISSSEYKFRLAGCSLDGMFQNLFNNSFNNNKWFSVFGKLGAVLVGATLLSQFFIGRTKNPDRIMEDK